ncbi:MAG: hypothetical protein RL456_1803 [Pseudomonadota bacterium]|jgi:hypothetical protein
MVIHAHILGTGPSLTATWRRCGFGPVIAINRAVDFTAADWLVAGDGVTFDRIRSRPLQGVCSFNAVLRERPSYIAGLRTIAWEDLPALPDGPAQWGLQAALLLARHLGNGEDVTAHLFGVDWQGSDDWDGTPAADDRSAGRWARERAQVDQTINHLAAATRTTVIRHLS